MKMFGWTGAVLCAIVTTGFICSGRESAAKATPAGRLSASAADLSSEAGVRFIRTQPRHWRHLVLGR